MNYCDDFGCCPSTISIEENHWIWIRISAPVAFGTSAPIQMMELLDDLFGHEGAPAWVLFLCSADNELISDFLSFSENFRGKLKKEDIVEKIKDVESPPQYQRLINFTLFPRKWLNILHFHSDQHKLQMPWKIEFHSKIPFLWVMTVRLVFLLTNRKHKKVVYYGSLWCLENYHTEMCAYFMMPLL